MLSITLVFPLEPFVSINDNSVIKLLKDNSVLIELYSKVFKSLSVSKLYPIEILSDNLLLIEPKKFEFFHLKNF